MLERSHKCEELYDRKKEIVDTGDPTFNEMHASCPPHMFQKMTAAGPSESSGSPGRRGQGRSGSLAFGQVISDDEVDEPQNARQGKGQKNKSGFFFGDRLRAERLPARKSSLHHQTQGWKSEMSSTTHSKTELSVEFPGVHTHRRSTRTLGDDEPFDKKEMNREMVMEMKRDLEQSKNDLAEKEKQLKKTEKQRDEVQKELKVVRAKLTKTRRERALLRQDKGKDEDQLSLARMEIESVRGSLTSARDVEVMRLHQEIESIRDKLRITEENTDMKEARLSELEDEVQKLTNQKAKQMKTIESLTMQRDEQRAELESMKNSLSQQKEKTKELEVKQLNAATLEAERFHQLTSVAQELDGIKDEKDALKREIKDIKSERDELASKQEDQVAKIETSKTVVGTLQNGIEALMKENAKLKEQVLTAEKDRPSGVGNTPEAEKEEVGSEAWLDIERAMTDESNLNDSKDDEDGDRARRKSLWRWSLKGKQQGKTHDSFEEDDVAALGLVSTFTNEDEGRLRQQLQEKDELIQSLEAAAKARADTIKGLKSDFVLLKSTYKMKEYSSRKEIQRLEEEVAILNNELGQDGEQSMRRLTLKAEQAAAAEKPSLENDLMNGEESVEKTRTVVETWINKTKASKNKREAEELVESLQAEIVEMKARAHLASSDKDDEIQKLREEKRQLKQQIAALEKAFKTLNSVAQYNPGSNGDLQGARVVTTVESLEKLDQEIGALRAQRDELEQNLKRTTALLHDEREKSSSLKKAYGSEYSDH